MNKQVLRFASSIYTRDKRYLMIRIFKYLVIMIVTYYNINFVNYIGKYINTNPTNNKLIVFIIFIVAILFALNGLLVIINSLINRVSSKINNSLMIDFLNYTQKYKYNEFEQEDVIKDLSKKKGYIQNMTWKVIGPLEQMIESSVKSIVAISSMVLILTSYIFMVPVLLLTIYFNGIIQKKQAILDTKWWQEGAAKDHEFRVIHGIVNDNRYAKDFRLTKVANIISKMYDDSNQFTKYMIFKYSPLEAKLECLQVLSFKLNNVVIYILIAILYFQGSISEGEVTVLYIASNTFVNNISGVFSNLNTILGLMPAIEEMNEVLSFNGNKTETDKLVSEVSSIEFKDVSFKYDSDYVFKNVSFKLDMKRDLVIIGENGSGKTTLLKLIMGLYEVCSGEVLVNGEKVERSLIDYVSIMQNEFIPILSIREILGGANDKLITQALDFVNLDILQSKYDMELGAKFEKEGIELSGGEKQKLLLARALLSNKKLWIFDEPTSNIDPVSKNDIFNVLATKKDVTKILITHDSNAIKGNEQLLLLKAGTVKYANKASDVLQFKQ